MYQWWGILKGTAMWQMFILGIVLGYTLRTWFDIRKGKNVEKNKKGFHRGLALIGISAVVSVWIIIQANLNEAPLFLIYHIFYEYLLCGAGAYAFWHIVPGSDEKRQQQSGY